MSNDNNKPQHDEDNEITEQELDTVSGGFNPQPDPPRIERIQPHDLSNILIHKTVSS